MGLNLTKSIGYGIMFSEEIIISSIAL